MPGSAAPGSTTRWSTATSSSPTCAAATTSTLAAHAVAFLLAFARRFDQNSGLAEIIDIAFAARPATISFEAANPRHAHEWILFEQVKLPEGKIIIPGVIESKSNFIEHPELIAQRIARYANLVGRDNVVAGSDCGFGTWVGQAAVDPDVCGPNCRR